MHSLIEMAESLKGQGDTKDYWRGVNDVIALIKQHERPVDEAIPLHFIKENSGGIGWHLISAQYENQYGGLMTVARDEEFNSLRPYLKQQQPVSAVTEAARKLLIQYDAYQNSAGNHEEAYYKLAKYAYPHWQELKAAMQGENLTAKE